LSGYTPVFGSIYSGSLHGQWPAAALMATLLPLCDKNGTIDLHPKAISAMTGWPMKLLLLGLEQLSSPDPESRSQDAEGRRLVPLDAGRAWGWRLVNFVSYREKARLSAKSAREVESGENSERIRYRNTTRPPVTAGDRRSPPVTDPSNANTNKKEEGVPPGIDLSAWDAWFAYRKAAGKAIKPASVAAAQRKLAGFGDRQASVVEHSVANGYQGLYAPDAAKPAPRKAQTVAIGGVEWAV